jgi:lysophospholipase L1-like esterase
MTRKILALLTLIGLAVAPGTAQQPPPSAIPLTAYPLGDRRNAVPLEPVVRPAPRRLATVDPCAGRTDGPCAFPRLDTSQIAFAGRIYIPAMDSLGAQIEYGAGAAGFSEDGSEILIGCRMKSVNQDGRGMIWRGTVPPIGGMSKEIAPCTGLTLAAMDGIAGPGAYFPLLGGVSHKGGRYIVNGYVTYDAAGLGTQRRTWWVGPSLSQLTGPVEGQIRNGLVMRDQSRIPIEWQAMLGGDLGVSAGYSSIISRSSAGSSFTTFWSKDVGTPGFPMHFLLGCPFRDPATGADIPVCAGRYGSPTHPYYYNGSEESGGTFIAPGTRTLVVLTRESLGPTCYGYATTDKSKHGTPYPDAINPSPENVPWCWSLSDHPAYKGPKGYPYIFVRLLYDLAELVEVKAGRKKAWEIDPYAVETMPTSNDAFGVGWTGSAVFNSLTGMHYLVRELYPGRGIDVFSGFPREGSQQPPPTNPDTETRANSYDDGWQSAWVAMAQATLKAGGPKVAGKVLHVGDSMTYSAAYGTWAREAAPAGATTSDLATFQWLHTTANDASNGWNLSWQAVTANGGMGWQSPVIDSLLTDARTQDAQYVVWQLHTPDPNPGDVAEVERRILQYRAAGINSILTTVPPRVGAGYDDTITKPYNAALRALAQRLSVPLVDLYAEIDARRPNGTWAGTLISSDGVHLSGSGGGYTPTSDPYLPGGDPATGTTGEAARHSGYLLRTWLSAVKLKEIRAAVGDVTPPTDVDCVETAGAWGPGAPPDGWGACVEGAQRRRRTWTTTVAASGTNGRACTFTGRYPVGTTAIETQTRACSTGPTLSITATGSTRSCNLVGSASGPPDGSPGWGIQYQRKEASEETWTNHGARAITTPYKVSRVVPLGQWELRATWSRVGAIPVPVPVIVAWYCEPVPSGQ